MCARLLILKDHPTHFKKTKKILCTNDLKSGLAHYCQFVFSTIVLTPHPLSWTLRLGIFKISKNVIKSVPVN